MVDELKLSDNDFEIFGLPPRFALDLPGLDEQWKRLQSAAHPDRFVSEGAAAQRMAMQWAVRINEAHRRLKDPLLRAAYLCELNGQDLQADRHAAMPAAFLMRQMEWRESLEDASGLAEIEALAEEVAAERRTTLRQLVQQIDGTSTPDWPAIAQAVRGLMFVERFSIEIARRIDALAE